MAHDDDEQTGSSPSAKQPEESASKPPAFTLSQAPVIGGEIEGNAHKYEAAPVQDVPAAPPRAPEFEDLGPLPTSYHEDTLFLTARDPRWLFCYWDFDWAQYPADQHRYRVAQFFLKIRTASGAEETTVEIKPEARNWYVAVREPETSYAGELGYYAADGSWASLVTSGLATTPPDALAPDGEAQFATLPMHLAFEHMLELVADQMREGETLLEAVSRITGESREIAFAPGVAPTWTDEQRSLLTAILGGNVVDRVGMGSAEIDQLLRKELYAKLESGRGLPARFYDELGPTSSSLFSAIGASWSAQPFSTRAERGFFLHVNAEIIFYGGTHPDATVWIAGKQVALRPDGTFRYHFTLGDGDFSVPIVAQSPDKVERRSATLAFTRGTQRVGEVGSTGQPTELSPMIGQQ